MDTFQAEKASLQSRIDAMQRQTTGTSRNVGGQASGLRFGQDSGRVAPGVRTPFAPPAAKSRAFSSYPRVVGNGFVYQSHNQTGTNQYQVGSFNRERQGPETVLSDRDTRNVMQ